MEGTECGWCYRVPVMHGNGVPGVCLQVLSMYRVGNVSDDCSWWGEVVEHMAEVVVGVGIPVGVPGTYGGRPHERGGGVMGWLGNGGRSHSIGADALEVEDRRQGLVVRIVGCSSLAMGDLASSGGGHFGVVELVVWVLGFHCYSPLRLYMGFVRQWTGW